MLRHVGTTYALFEVYSATDDEKCCTEATGDCSPSHAGYSCVYDDDKVTVGGNALAILALLEHLDTSPGAEYLALAEKLAKWLVATLNAEGEFVTPLVLPSARLWVAVPCERIANPCMPSGDSAAHLRTVRYV